MTQVAMVENITTGHPLFYPVGNHLEGFGTISPTTMPSRRAGLPPRHG
jgi:hypothetical protein